jgi:hypothetical protein
MLHIIYSCSETNLLIADDPSSTLLVDSTNWSVVFSIAGGYSGPSAAGNREYM